MVIDSNMAKYQKVVQATVSFHEVLLPCFVSGLLTTTVWSLFWANLLSQLAQQNGFSNFLTYTLGTSSHIQSLILALKTPLMVVFLMWAGR